MSNLHYELNEKYGEYKLSYNNIPSESDKSKSHHVFHVIANKKNVMTGIYIPIGNFDLEMNVFVLSDISATLEKTIVNEVKSIRKKLIKNDIDIGLYKVMTYDNLLELLKSISTILDMEIIINFSSSDKIYEIILVKKILINDLV